MVGAVDTDWCCNRTRHRQSAVEALGQLRSTQRFHPARPTPGRPWLQLAAIDAMGEIGAGAVSRLVALVPARSSPDRPWRHSSNRRAGSRSRLSPTGWWRCASGPSATPYCFAVGWYSISIPTRGRSPSNTGQARARRLATFIAYLEEILHGILGLAAPDDGGDIRDGDSLCGGDGSTVMAGPRSMYPPVLIRIARTRAPPGGSTLSAKPGELSPALRQLLRHDDLRVRRGALLAGNLQEEDLPLVWIPRERQTGLFGRPPAVLWE